MIFKKQISILLTILLLISNLGLAFNIHFCANKIASITLNVVPDIKQEIDECCGIVEKDSSCCNDKILKAEIKSDQIIVKPISFEADFIPVAYDWNPTDNCSSSNFKKRDTLTYYCVAHSPPLYLLYSQYTLYA